MQGAPIPTDGYRPAGFCPFCGYRVDAGRCPECGRDVKRPWRVTPRTYRRGRLVIVLAALALIGGGAWWFGPGLAARYTPSSVLVWLWDRDGIGSKWAASSLYTRVRAAYSDSGYPELVPYRTFESRRRSTDDTDWTGRYSQASMIYLGGRELNLTNREALWASSAGFQLADVMQGDVARFDGVRLQLTLPTDRAVLRWRALRPICRFDTTLLLLRWSEWRFLVPPEELIDFCNDVNAGEPLEECHLTRFPDSAPGQRANPPCASLSQPPTLPRGHERLILPAAIGATVTRADPRPLPRRRAVADSVADAASMLFAVDCYRLELTSGRTSEAFVGMRLYPHDRLGMAHVTAVRGDSIEATYVELSVPGSHQTLSGGGVLSTLAPAPVALTRDTEFRVRMESLGYPTGPSLIDASGVDHAEVARLRRYMTPSDCLLRELALELRQER